MIKNEAESMTNTIKRDMEDRLDRQVTMIESLLKDK
jgi:hypothetical protein